MAKLTYKEWCKLGTFKEREARYRELSEPDQLKARCTTIYDESYPFITTNTPRVPQVRKRPSKEEYRKNGEYMNNWIYKCGDMTKEEYDEEMKGLEERLANYDEWPFPCDIIFKDDIYEK